MERSLMISTVEDRWRNEAKAATGSPLFGEDMHDLAETAVDALIAAGAMKPVTPGRSITRPPHDSPLTERLDWIERELDLGIDGAECSVKIHRELRDLGQQVPFDTQGPEWQRFRALTERVVREVFGVQP